MIVLDTNVVSEFVRQEPNAAVREWLNAQTAETLYITSITSAEALFGIGLLPDGRRKHELAQLLGELLAFFEGRVLAFDSVCASHYADIAVAARRAGKSFPTPDGYIAAIARTHGFAVATRDDNAFKAAGVPVIDPWTA